jgi:hypothetical protein
MSEPESTAVHYRGAKTNLWSNPGERELLVILANITEQLCLNAEFPLSAARIREALTELEADTYEQETT